MSDTYEFPPRIDFEHLLLPITQAEDALARLDERLRLSPLAERLRARVDFREACASQLAEGELVHLEDLVLFDAGAFDARPVSPASLSSAFHTLQLWRRARQEPPGALLRSNRPGEFPPAAERGRNRETPPHAWPPGNRFSIAAMARHLPSPQPSFGTPGSASSPNQAGYGARRSWLLPQGPSENIRFPASPLTWAAV